MRAFRPGRLLLTVLVLGFAVFFGLDLATRGMERVQGPVERPVRAPAESPASSAAATPRPKPVVVKTQSAQTQAPRPQPKPDVPPQVEVKESFLNQLSSKLGDALYHAAKALMHLIVSLFDALVS